MVRRQADRELFGLIERKTGLKPADFLGRRKRRRVIRHICQATFLLGPDQELARGATDEPMPGGLSCRVLDLHDDGAMVLADRELGVGRKYGFVIRLFDDNRDVIECIAEVRWTRWKEARKGYALGLQLLELSADGRTRLRDFLTRLDETLGL
jgi:hypothetical protein